MKNKCNIKFKKRAGILIIFFIPIVLFAQSLTPPQCYGGNRLTREFIDEEMIYPSRSLNAKIEGTVELSFLVQPDGRVTDIKLTKRVADDIDAEAIRILEKILWHPATQIGKPVVYRHWMKIKFKINKYLKHFESRDPSYYALPYKPVDSSNIVYRRAEVDQLPRPIFTSIDRNLAAFISNNLEYPEAAFKGNVAGTVKLRFVVEPSGRISNIEVINAVGAGCTEEAIRVLKMIKWFPGLKDKLAVRTFVPLEITFDISKKTVGGSIPSPGQVY
ncbi:MAG: energy transducer TonB [Bacteroidales bacterium]